MRCSQVQNLLPEYVEGALVAAQQEALSAHLHACPACAAEERSYQLAFDALHARRSSPAPDLWAAFSARMANELTCAEARELIPLQADPALLAGRADALQSHLASCSPCAAESAVMGRAVAALEAVPTKAPQVDLWPSFAARTGNAPARTSVLGSIRRALSPARNPLAAPILAMAAFAGILFGAQFVLNVSGQQAEPAPPVAKLPASTPSPVSQPEPSKAKPAKPVKVIAKADRPASTSATPRPRRQPRTAVLATAVPILKPQSDAAKVAKITKSIRPRVTTVAFDPGITPAADTTLASPPVKTDSNSEAAQEKVMPEVVQAVALLLDFGDSASNPFGGAE